MTQTGPASERGQQLRKKRGAGKTPPRKQKPKTPLPRYGGTLAFQGFQLLELLELSEVLALFF
ncbi:MAG: hypothetical protein ACP5NF_07335, partial [Thermoanaerobaculum sp.]